MANISQGTTQEQPQEEKPEGINLDEITAEQAFSFITNAVRAQSFTYIEHVQLEQARVSVGNAIGFGK
mgnify:CR=1 FL=1|jgi:hypothetical protein